MNRIYLFLFLFSGIIVEAQVSVVLKSKNYDADTRELTLELKPTFGLDSISLISLYGEESPTKRPDTSSFYVEYENIPSEKIVQAVPTYLGVENLSKTVDKMPNPSYSPDEIERKSTLSWKITFSNIPEYAGCVKFYLAGTYYEIGDLPLAEKSRDARLEDFLEDRVKKQYSFSEVSRAYNDTLDQEIKNYIAGYLTDQPNTNYFGKMTWTIDTLGNNKFSLLDDTSNVEPLEVALKKKFSELNLPISKKFGYAVNAKATYSILVTSGVFKVNNTKGKPKYYPDITSEEIKAFVKKKLLQRAPYKVQIKYASVNGQPLPRTSATAKKIFLNKDEQNIFIFGSFFALGIIIAALSLL